MEKDIVFMENMVKCDLERNDSIKRRNCWKRNMGFIATFMDMNSVLLKHQQFHLCVNHN